MKSTAERKAVQDLRKGNSTGFTFIFHRYHKQLFYLSTMYVKDTQLAEDVVQDVFINIWLKRETLDPDKPLKVFLITCLQNHIRNVIRNRKRRILGAYQLTEENHPRTSCTSDDIQLKEYHTILDNGISQLPDKRQQIYRLKVKEGLSNAEVANHLKISVNTVKAHYFQGNKFIKSYLGKEAGIAVNT